MTRFIVAAVLLAALVASAFAPASAGAGRVRPGSLSSSTSNRLAGS